MNKNFDLNVASMPREKLIKYGKRNVSNVELLQIIISSGNGHMNGVEIAEGLLNTVDGRIEQLLKYEVQDLLKIKGFGKAKSCILIAAFELSKRARFSSTPTMKIQSSMDAFQLMYSKLADLKSEEFWIVCLNRNAHVIDTIRMFVGGLTATIVDVRLLFHKLINNLSASFLVVHNHPSGNLNPSKSDRAITKKIMRASIIFDIPLLDHLIIADNTYFSFSDNQILK